MHNNSKSFENVALLVDGDNVPATYAGQILRRARALGPLKIRRAYGNAARVGGWSQAPSFRVIHAGQGKNGADILLAIQAMEFALTDDIGAFVIATSDRDFSHLAHRLRELGKYVLGLGEAEKAPEHFRKACVTYTDLNRPETAASEKELPQLDREIMKVIRATDTTGAGALLQSFNAEMRKHRPDFKISGQPEKSWPAYLKARPDHYNIVGTGTEKRILIVTKDPET